MCGLIDGVRVVPRRTVVGDIDRRFDNLSGSHHDMTLMMTSLRLSKRRSTSPTTVLLGTTLTRTIKPHKQIFFCIEITQTNNMGLLVHFIYKSMVGKQNAFGYLQSLLSSLVYYKSALLEYLNLLNVQWC